MRTFVAFALLLALAFAEGEMNIKFLVGENLTDAEGQFSYRWQSASIISTPTIPVPLVSFPEKVYAWSSVSVDVKASSQSAVGKANAMISAAFPPSQNSHPFLILGYGSGEAAAKFDPSAFLTTITGTSVFSGGLVGMLAFNLEEIDADGKIVKTLDLKGACSPKAINAAEGMVDGMTCSMPFGDTKVTITYLTSKQAGILEYGDTPVSPRSIEMIIEVDNFGLSNKDNHVRLNLPMVTAKGAGKVDGNAQIISKDSEDVYVAVSGYVAADKERDEVNVEVKAESNYLSTKDITLQAFLTATLGGDFDFRVAHVDFPAGVESFVYDPAAGSGSNVYKAGASTMALSVLVALVCALLYLF